MNVIKPDVLQLNEFFLTKLNIKWIEAEKKSEEIICSIDYDVARNIQNNRAFKLILRCSIYPKLSKDSEVIYSGYEIETEIVGIFYFPEGFDEGDMQLIIRDNGCRILYGILRGEIASITGSFHNGKFTLPTVNMRRIIIDTERNRKKVSKSSSAKKLPAKKKVAKTKKSINKPIKKMRVAASKKS